MSHSTILNLSTVAVICLFSACDDRTSSTEGKATSKNQSADAVVADSSNDAGEEPAENPTLVSEELLNQARSAFMLIDATKTYLGIVGQVHERGKAFHDLQMRVYPYRANAAASGNADLAAFVGVLADECESVAHDLKSLSAMEKLFSLSTDSHAAAIMAEEYRRTIDRTRVGAALVGGIMRNNQRRMDAENGVWFKEYADLVSDLEAKITAPRFHALRKHLK